MHSQDSLIHSSENLLCGDLTGRVKRVKSSPTGYRPCPQSLEPSNVGEHPSSPTTSFVPSDNFSSITEPIPAPDMDPRMLHSMDLVASEYTDRPPMYTSNQLQFPGYFLVTDDGFVLDAHNSLMPTYEPPSIPLDFGGIPFEPITSHQPPTPPAAPEQSIPSSPAFLCHPCRWMGGPQCDGLAPGKNREMAEHLRVSHRFIGHERDQVQCQWEGCGQFIQRMNIPRHIVSRHLLAAAVCRFCGKRFSRPDVVARHERTCGGVSPISRGPFSRA